MMFYEWNISIIKIVVKYSLRVIMVSGLRMVINCLVKEVLI